MGRGGTRPYQCSGRTASSRLSSAEICVTILPLPLTSLILELIRQNTNTTTTNAAAQAIAAFDLPHGVNLGQYDPFQANNDSNAVILFKAAAQVHSLTKEISSLLSGTLTNISKSQWT